MKIINKTVSGLLLFNLVFSVFAVHAETVTATSDRKRFSITVKPKEELHPFFGMGSKIGFLVDGEQGKPIVLTRGVAYKFDVDSNVRHDFYFSTSKAGWGMGTVNEGVKGQFTYRGTVKFTPSEKTPDNLYYACRNHKYMGGKIYVANEGDRVKVDKERPKVKTSSQSITPQKVKNKLMYAKMIERTSKSDPAMIDRAKSLIEKAQTLLKEGEIEEAMTAAHVAVALFKGKKTKEKVDLEELKKRYTGDSESLEGLEVSYAKQSKKFKVDGGLNRDQFNELKESANKQAKKKNYQEAIKLLSQARNLISSALSAILKDNQIVDNRDFSDPKEAFKYDLERYEGYVELIPIGIEMKKPSDMMKKMMLGQVDKSKKTMEEAKRRAKNKNYSDANILINQAIGEIKRALRLIGVR